MESAFQSATTILPELNAAVDKAQKKISDLSEILDNADLKFSG